MNPNDSHSDSAASKNSRRLGKDEKIKQNENDNHDIKDTDAKKQKEHKNGNKFEETSRGKNTNKFRSNGTSKDVDPRFKRLLWYLICSTREGINRSRIIYFLNENPSNANQLSNQLKLDYKTIIHHLGVLKKKALVLAENEDSYGATYFIFPLIEKIIQHLSKLWTKLGKSKLINTTHHRLAHGWIS